MHQDIPQDALIDSCFGAFAIVIATDLSIWPAKSAPLGHSYHVCLRLNDFSHCIVSQIPLLPRIALWSQKYKSISIVFSKFRKRCLVFPIMIEHGIENLDRVSLGATLCNLYEIFKGGSRLL